MTSLTNFVVVISFFCGCKRCVGSDRTTAFNTQPVAWSTVAYNHLPRNTRLTVDGLPYVFTVNDRLPNRRWYSDRLDIYIGHGRGKHTQAKQLGIRTAQITLVP